jgi:putative methionine-R-sulfoxide reductase with GAF domain
VSAAVRAVELVLEEGGEADEVLRAVVRALAGQPDVTWAAVAFLEEGELVVGPSEGKQSEDRRARVPVRYDGALVGELWVDGQTDAEALERVAALVADHVLVGWDTGGEDWRP